METSCRCAKTSQLTNSYYEVVASLNMFPFESHKLGGVPYFTINSDCTSIVVLQLVLLPGIIHQAFGITIKNSSIHVDLTQ